MIRYIPNDPTHAELARSERPAAPPKGSARIQISPAAPATPFPPGTDGYNYWQAEQALVYGLKAWKELAGAPLAAWEGGRRTLPVLLDVGQDLNANYDRRALNFYHYPLPTGRVFSCDSPDVTCHEQGHALLDALRPDFWGAPYLEIAAFHESWGDCMAMLVAFEDLAQCAAALEAGLDTDNLISNLAEELAVAIAEGLGKPEFVDAPPPRAALRKARNHWRYTDPAALPPSGPARELQSEPHSFSRVFTGCFYDLIRNLVSGARLPSPAALREGARLAGGLLIAAAQTVPVVPKFFQAVADRMLQADAQLHQGLHAAALRAAFDRHGLTLGPPRKSLSIPLMADKKRVTARNAAAALVVGSGAGVAFTNVRSQMHGDIAHVAAYQPEDVSGVHPSLAGVFMLVPATARLQMARSSVVGVLGEPHALNEAARLAAKHFVKALIEFGNLEGDDALERPLPARPARRPGPATHVIQTLNGKRTIVRARFA